MIWLFAKVVVGVGGGVQGTSAARAVERRRGDRGGFGLAGCGHRLQPAGDIATRCHLWPVAT